MTRWFPRRDSDTLKDSLIRKLGFSSRLARLCGVGRAPTLTAAGVVRPQVEEAVLAAIASFALHVVFADTLAGQRVAQAAAFRPGRVAVTG